jgi:hypothetical protein
MIGFGKSCADIDFMKLLKRVNAVGMRRHLAASTIACYQTWIRDFLRDHRHGMWLRSLAACP